MLCPACARVRADESGASCPECGAALVPATNPHLEAFAQATVRRHIERWRADGLVDLATATRLEASLVPSETQVPAPPPAKQEDPAARVEAWAEEVAASLREAASWRPGWGTALARSLDEAAKAEREEAARRRAGARTGDSGEDDLGSALGSGQALFAQGAGSIGGGLEAVVALDEGSASAPRLNEYIWWFLGAVLVLGGSLMGVREAWRALGGVPRQLLVTGALFGYHAAFIGLGVFLSRRSLSAGRILAGIGLALLPVVFVALSALVALTPVLGVAVAVGVAGVGLLPLRSAGRLLYGASGVSLAVALLPSLLASLPLMGLEEAPWLRALCASAGVVALGASVWRSRAAGSAMAALVGSGAALYGALCLALFCVASAPSGFDALEPGSALFAGMTLWAMALAAVVAVAATSDAVRDAHPRAGPVLETLAHAVVASGALAGALGAFSGVPGDDFLVDVASVLAPAAAAGLFYLLEHRRRALVHPAAMAAVLAGVVLARTQAPDVPAWWLFGAAAVCSGLMLVAWANEFRGTGLRLLAWGAVGSLVTMLAFTPLGWSWGPVDAGARALSGLVIAGAAHLAGRWRWRGLHYLGGVAVLFGALAALEGVPELDGSWATLGVFGLAGWLYGLAGLAQAAWMRRAGQRDELRPLEDLSLGMASLGVVLAVGVTPELPTLFAWLPGNVLACVPTVLAAMLLLLRARRDGSRLVAFLAASGFGLVVAQATGTVADFRSARAALVAASVALGFAVLAALRGPAVVVQAGPSAGVRVKGRRVLGIIPLPFGAHGLPLFLDGFAAAALVQAVAATLTLAQWLSNPSDIERPGVLLAGGLLTASAVVAFVSRGFVVWRLRGSVGTLAVAGGFIALTAIINRAGRPLPPDVSAWRLPLIGMALWGVALATRRFGPALGALLENPRHGPLYHAVPHAGVAALALVLVRLAVNVGMPDPSRALGVVPPLSLLGAALLSLLLAASFRSVFVAQVGLLLGLPGAALWAARQDLLGPALVALLPPDGQWVHAAAVLADSQVLDWLQPEAWLAPGDTLFFLWQRAFAGIAAAGLVYSGAALALRQEALQRALRWWSVAAVALVGAAAFFQPGLLSAGLAFATGAVLFLGGARQQGRAVLGVGFLLLVHAQAHRVPVLESWPGPVLAAVAFAVVVLSPWVARKRGLEPGATRVRAQQAAGVYFAAALMYALAVGGDTSPVLAVPMLLWRMFLGMGGSWMLSAALPVTLALLAASLLVAAFQWRGAFAGFVASLGSTVAGGAVVSALMASIVIRMSLDGLRPSYFVLFTVHGASLALAAAASALLPHLASRWTQRSRRDVAEGLG
ncbi:hypothetical protein HPC49_16575, partial [Pyxidicoccus fallax]